MYDTQQLLELRTLNPSVVVDGIFDGINSAASIPQLRPKSRKLDETGSTMLPLSLKSGQGVDGHTPRARQAGGMMAATLSSLEGQVVRGGNQRGEDDMGGPPFKTQSERRQWLLQEKRRWLVEMRHGK